MPSTKLPEPFSLTISSKLLPICGLLIVYLVGAQAIGIMDIDAAQYASIGREMTQNNNFFEVQHRGVDYYLDKPPLLFWVSALVFKLLGFTHFAYRLVPILSTLAGLYAVYRFTRLYYPELTAYTAALVMGSCQAYFLMNHDVRTDTLLTNCVILAVWQLATYRLKGGWAYFLGGFFWIGMAMLAKGPIGLIVPASAFFIDILLKRDWKNLFRWEWLLGPVIIGIVLLPYCIGLFHQYGIDGIYFFFWKQSFGRITGENDWDNNASLWYQAQNFIWSFLPWVLVCIGGLASYMRMLFRQKFLLASNQEALAFGGFVLPFIALSTSHYQLPHYTFVVFPLGAVLTARYLLELVESRTTTSFKYARIALMVTAGVMVLIILLLCSWAFPLNNIVLVLTTMGILLYAGSLFMAKKSAYPQIVLAPFWLALACNFVLNTHIYPSLLTYQTGSELGFKLSQRKKYAIRNLYILDTKPKSDYYLFPHALDFYTTRNTPIIRSVSPIAKLFSSSDTVWLYTDKKGLAIAQDSLVNRQVQIDTTFQKYHVTMITLPFLNPKLRSTRTREVYLVKVF